MSHLSLLMYKKFLVTTLLAEVGKGGKQRFRVYHTGQFRITSISGGDFEVIFILGENFHPAKSSLLEHNPGQKTQTVSTLSSERPEIHDGSSCNVSTAVTIAVPELVSTESNYVMANSPTAWMNGKSIDNRYTGRVCICSTTQWCGL